MNNMIDKKSKDLVDKLDKKIIKAMEADIPISLNPYQKIASDLDIKLSTFLQRLKSLKERKILKRVSAVLHHRDSGYRANAMFVCYFNENEIEKIGKEISKLKEVSHCYQRKCYQNWPYNFYAMIHGKNKEKLEKIMNEIKAKYNIKDFQILYSTEELKKTSMKYFISDFDK